MPTDATDPTPDLDATDRDPDPDAWLGVSEAAALESITTRAIQRRAAAGKYEARKVETAKGEQWEIKASSLKGTATPTATDRPEPKRDPDPERRDHSPDSDRDRRDRERLESEVLFLRGLIEQRDRDAAELRAALREALRLMPKELGEGKPTATDPTPTATQAAPTVSDPVKPASNARKREVRPFWKLFLGIR
jgi:hypothetical protein